MGAITVTQLGKAYRQYSNRWARLAEWFLPGSPSRHRLKWVLQEIDFSVRPGEAVGIIGLNGAGKSTLLKIITGTAQPTTGHVRLNGRVAALLELGIGFHPEFTGRQNVYMAGQLLGYSAVAIGNMMPDIEAFAGIGDYIDQPVRVYSSGMQVRLAFSVATAQRPDILIVDEALSVGDAYFQHRSFERIRDFQKLGTTLLIVSHDKQAIQSICDRAILLYAGRKAMEGKPEAVMDYYNALLAEHQEQKVRQIELPSGHVRTESGTGEAEIKDITLIDAKNVPMQMVAVGQLIRIRIVVAVNHDIDSLVLGCGIKDRLGQMMFGTNTFHTSQVLTGLKQGETCVYTVSCLANLGVGSYSIHASLVRNHSHVDKNYHWIDGASIFEVYNRDKNYFVGCLWNDMNFLIEKTGQPALPHSQPDDLDRELVVVDVGCRWGFAEKFTDAKGRFRVYGFDPDREECERLHERYQGQAVSLIPLALAGSPGRRTLHLTEEPACSSLFAPDPDLTQNFPALRCARQVSSREVETTTLDAWAQNEEVAAVDYIKLDTQGSELEILQGGKAILRSVRCVEVEIEFNHIYQGQPLFSEVDSFLRGQGFVLWKLTNQVHYSRDGVPETPIGEDTIFYDEKQQIKHQLYGGQLYWANAHYVRKDVLNGQNSPAQNVRDVTLFESLSMPDVVSHLKASGLTAK